MTTGAPDSDDLDLLYDANRAPDPRAWLAMSEYERIDAVALHHAEDAPHAVPPAPEAHAAFHVAVENQIAERTPPMAAATVDRLVAEGLSRHDAIHAVGGALSRALYEMMQSDAPFDAAAYDRDLAQITAEGWLATASDTAEGDARPAPRPRPRPPKRRRRARR